MATFERTVRGTTIEEVIYRCRRKHYRNRIRRAGYFNAGARRRRMRFSAQAHRELAAQGDPQAGEYRANLMRFLYGWFTLRDGGKDYAC